MDLPLKILEVEQKLNRLIDALLKGHHYELEAVRKEFKERLEEINRESE